MFRNHQLTVRLIVVGVIFATFSLLAVPAQAQGAAPMITVNPVWRPAQQLKTIDLNNNGDTDPGDDIRYVAVDIYATTTVQFWAVGFTCTLNKLALERYDIYDDAGGGPGNNIPNFLPGGEWPFTFRSLKDDILNSTGELSFAIAIAGDSSPAMGTNGVSETLHLATLRFRVKDDLAAAITSGFTCTTQFLNRDGKVVLAATYVAPPALSIIPGYVLSGKVTYQGLAIAPTAGQAIEIACDDPDGDTIPNDFSMTANLTTGLFSISDLRAQGSYFCLFDGNIFPPGNLYALHLRGFTDFTLNTAKLALLPIVLKNGNVEDAASPVSVANPDVTLVTSNLYNTAALPFDLGDANGDKTINAMDLALVAGSYGSTGSPAVRAHHLIYSLPRDNFAFQNSHLWLGSEQNSSVSRFVPGNTRDYWPAVAPDGSRIAWVRNVGTMGNDKFALFVAPITNGVVGAAKQITPAGAPYDAFAPSWSPTGERLAFVCSYNDDWFDAVNPHGDLCLITPGGVNLQRIQGEFFGPGAGTRPVTVKIYPPAWVGSQWLYFGYSALSGTPDNCDNRICFISLTDNGVTVPAALPAGARMPVVRDGVLGRALFYHVDLQGIRYAVLNSGDAFPQAAYPTANLHNDVFVANVPIPYFTVSTGSDPHIFVYRTGLQWGDGGILFTQRYFTLVISTPTWSGDFSTTYRISDGVGNPALGTEYYAALLNTVAFLP